MRHSPDAPRLIPCWEAHVDIAPTETMGEGPAGTRLIVPILGGRFEGRLDPDGPREAPFRGEILPGGWDLQRVRPDGCKELEAIYHMRTREGATVEIRNHCLLDYDAEGGLAYARSRVRVEAPVDGACAWLNRRVFVGSVEVVRPQEQVLIRVWLLD